MIVKGESLRASLCTAVLLSVVLLNGCAGARELMLVGNDEKTHWNDAGAAVNGLAGKDEVLVIDIGGDRLAPKIVARLPLMNSIFGPPTNLAITPDGSSHSSPTRWTGSPDGAGWKPSPDNKLYVIDLKADPPKLIDTVQGRQAALGPVDQSRWQPRARSPTAPTTRSRCCAIAGKKVKLIDTVAMGEQVAHVAFTPDGKRALAAKFPDNKIALLDVDGEKVTYTKQDMPVGLWPYNLDVTPDGKLALTADNGFAGSADGNVDTISVIDIEANPPRVIDKMVVDDGARGIRDQPDRQVRGGGAVARQQRGQDRRSFTTATGRSRS